MAEYKFHDEAENIANSIMERYHPELFNNKVKIAHLVKIKLGEASVSPTGELIVKKKRGRKPSNRQGRKIKMASTSKVSPKMLALAAEDFAFIIEYDPVIWANLTIEQQTALVDHELSHCGVDADGYYIKHHDLEEFRAIVERHGFWMPDIKQFANSTEKVFHDPALNNPNAGLSA